MKKTNKSLNKNVADFTYKGRNYEIDLLLDSIIHGFASYDVFDVTEDKQGALVVQLFLDNSDYMPSELITLAKEEIEE